jgi:ERCC4-type nuclease
LLKNFDSPEKIRNTSANELEKLVGKSKASILTKFFKNQL